MATRDRGASRGRERAALAVLVVALSGACENPLPPDENPPDENPIAPTSCGSVPERTVPVGGSANVRVCFSDENGDPLSLYVKSSSGAVAVVAADDSTVTVQGVRPGTATVTVTAMDPGGLSGTVSFSVWVPRVVRLTDRGRSPAWSPDGSRIAFARATQGNFDGSIFVMNADGGGVTRLTKSVVSIYESEAVWSPGGSRIAFTTGGRDSSEIYVVNADGGGATNLTDTPGFDGCPAWSPDGTRIAFSSLGGWIC
ncbi:MAG: hypothetical protein F4187_07485 [Gemmatimonadetes bacterium]|nr:hypothetical protein [Gemmatimonadota bacterium]